MIWTIIQLVISGIAMGFVYALIGIEYTLIYNATFLAERGVGYVLCLDRLAPTSMRACSCWASAGIPWSVRSPRCC